MGAPYLPFQTPLILTGFCYLSGMAMFLSVLFWQWRIYKGRDSVGSLRRSVGLWLLRVLVAITVFSLSYMVIFRPPSPVIFVPEASLLAFITVLYMKIQHDRHIDWPDVFAKQLPLEMIKVGGVAFLCLLGWVVSLSLGWAVFKAVSLIPGRTEWIAVFLIGLLWNGPLLWLYLAIQTKTQRGAAALPPQFKFYKLLWPVLLAYLFIMLPAVIELIANAPKVREMMQAGPPLSRV